MKSINNKSIANFFRDNKGNVVFWQWPNVPLYGWIFFKILSFVINSNNIKNFNENLSIAFLFTWAYLEITDGSSYFRRLLGVIVMVVLIFGFYKQSWPK